MTSAGDSRPGPRHSRRLRRHSWRRAVALVALTAITFTGTTAWATYGALQGNIDGGHDLDEILGEPTAEATAEAPTDPKAGSAYNILVLGSDSRQGDNAGIGGYFEGMRSDTTLFVHIAADRSRIEVVSIPRDLLVDVPACPLPDGSTSAPYAAGSGDGGTRFNTAFAVGSQGTDAAYGAACAVLTVQELTGIRVDDFAVVDFTGFSSMVDALGGVPMCIPETMDDPSADLYLEAGDQVLDGQQALAFARARKTLTQGSDIGRIGRQQELLAAMVRQVLSKNLVTDLPALLRFLDAATSSLTTSSGLGSLTSLAGLATSLATLPAGQVVFTTVPFDYSGNVVVTTAESDALWALLASDQPISAPAEQTPADDGTATAEAPGAGASEEPSTVDDPGVDLEVTTGEDQLVCG